MIASIFRVVDQARLAGRALVEFGQNIVNPTIRLGITGLSRAGKTVFITALVHGLIRGGRFPVFDAYSSGRIAGVRLAPQPDDAVPRFDYEKHVRALVDERQWPASTRQMSELRVVIDYQSLNGARRTLTLDIVDYPGEWLLDIPLLELNYEQWSTASLQRSRDAPRAMLAKEWHEIVAKIDPAAVADENTAIAAARLFTKYLRACRDERFAMSVLPPGRFLMPGDLADSPALTFAPLELGNREYPPDSLCAMMRRRYEAYKDVVVRPFFNEHFLRLDRQIILVDAMAALNAGPSAVHDLQDALREILDCFNVGQKTFVSALFRPRTDKVLFAATKADHLHHASHDRLEAFLKRIVEGTANRAEMLGAEIDVVALAAVRATREAQVRRNGESLPSIVGIAEPGESVAGQIVDGETEVAVFPGDLPDDPDVLLRPGTSSSGGAVAVRDHADLRFLRFRPPHLEASPEGAPALPHIRLDRALQFLIGDHLQ
ncbi:MAG: YcjX family protein [Rhizobiales bacterium]|nr:YcjX family protein [Hyphomicrobiales bacterium]